MTPMRFQPTIEKGRMWRHTTLFISFIIYFAFTESYVIVHDRCHMGIFNETVNKDFVLTLRKFNRTTWAVDYSFTLLRDLDNDLFIQISIDRLASNEYRPMGVFLKFNACDFFKKNIFGVASQIKEHGNIDCCHLVKGKYYLKNLTPDTSKFPKYLPLGSYRIHIETLNHNMVISDSYWYSTVVDSY